MCVESVHYGYCKPGRTAHRSNNRPGVSIRRTLSGARMAAGPRTKNHFLTKSRLSSFKRLQASIFNFKTHLSYRASLFLLSYLAANSLVARHSSAYAALINRQLNSSPHSGILVCALVCMSFCPALECKNHKTPVLPSF